MRRVILIDGTKFYRVHNDDTLLQQPHLQYMLHMYAACDTNNIKAFDSGIYLSIS